MINTISNHSAYELLTVADLMRAAPYRRPFDHDGWVFELKLGGSRVLVRRNKRVAQLLPRRTRFVVTAFPEIIAVAESLPVGTVLDCEVIVPDELERPSFDLLRRRAEVDDPSKQAAAAWKTPAMLYVFDCLFSSGRDYRTRPLLERKAEAARLVTDMQHLRSQSFVAREGIAAFDRAVACGAEALVAKKASSTYRAGRRPGWLKVNNPSYSRTAEAAKPRSAFVAC